MPDIETVTTVTTDVPTTNTSPSPIDPGSSASPTNSGSSGEPHGDARYSSSGPTPSGTTSEAIERHEEGRSNPTEGTGVDGEVVVWESTYSMRNFLGRIILRSILTIGWIGLAVFAWSYGYSNLETVAIITGVVLLILWLALGYRILMAKGGHFYKLTNRRLFISTGVFGRRRDQMELLRIDDIYTRQQSLLERWLGLGTVVVTSKERSLPTFYLVGVDDPKRVMDLIWHQTRAEHDQRTTRIDSV